MSVIRYVTSFGERYIIGPNRDVALELTRDPRGAKVLSEPEARIVVRAWAESAPSGALHDFASSLGLRGASSADDRQVIGSVLARIGWNLTVAREATRTFAPAPGSARVEVRAPEPPAERVRTWIEIELLDMAGQPIANAAYEVRAPDGTVTRGRTDRDGLGRVEGLTPGSCEVIFPELDEEAWAAA